MRGAIASKALGYRIVSCGMFVGSVIGARRCGQRKLAGAVQSSC